LAYFKETIPTIFEDLSEEDVNKHITDFSNKYWDDIWAKMDSNEDGNVDKEEFARGISTYLFEDEDEDEDKDEDKDEDEEEEGEEYDDSKDYENFYDEDWYNENGHYLNSTAV